ncbi:nondiscriminating glutamyl-tRNA synthetase [Breznakia sp. PF5-3]|uniref:glutamate--tRNA ligase n=1 Tax=unclassified Breznakia TaxID=2623764 RepID=UPI0024050D6F|nr:MULTISPECIES: glutamate--tRNA ligase [unclassified Breznakia]MDL2276512.1 glutamate--tRNA ligase [Breznakia sp. OttesenSCG-928-G09]MDF9825807.1 nondiscriminating glutamyl-tRNA synthetase [Breznakia sp. PM6-1]MDF9836612.1 nondiscriminating glutamyl-tRNA synthetase [Breznakia sp. PF5-3]MDF9838838.1 nondiscriminating glutamyl-tRNA synthetase [Breznakia sp. PFB2-8]MDF9860864.1 nondiscriminating glutamyl-tRNA synthetase [Breznakia sp. PH5-24]
MNKVRVRYAPSPTGHLHIGGARTALFNYLFAKHYDGDFIFRLEDTDIERNIEGGEASQLENLAWLGIVPDESPQHPNPECGPYRQMEALDIYKKYVDELLAKGLAYKCFCTPEELAAEKERQEKLGVAPMYNRTCANLSAEEVAAKEAQGLPYTIRVKVPENKTYVFKDMIRGEVSFESKDIGDWVIVKSNGIPTYNFAVTIDDHRMGITHVFRGEEHLSNTPKQLMIYEMLGFDAPTYGHMTLIVNEQHKKLSKRDESIMQFVSQYKEEGYIPEAMFNFLSLLGWSPEGEEEIFSKAELIKIFDEKRLSKSPSMFDKNKLTWVNNRYMKALPLEDVVTLARPFLEAAYDLSSYSEEWIIKLISLYHDQMSYGKEIASLASLFFKDDYTLDDEGKEVMSWETTPIVKAAFKEQLEQVDEWTQEHIKAAFKATQKATGIKGKPLFMGLRVSITAQEHGPDLTQTIELLGKEKVMMRLS